MHLSVAQRLGVGFGVVLGLIAIEILSSSAWHARSRDLQRQFADQLLPRERAACGVKDAVLFQTVAAQRLTLLPGPRPPGEYARAVRASRAAVDHLMTLLAGDPEGRSYLAAITPAAESYDRASEALLRLAGTTPDSAPLRGAADALATAQERVLTATRAYHDLQHRRGHERQAAIARVERELTARRLLLAALLIVAFAVTVGLTIRAVRRPARALVQAARALEQGDYTPARAECARVAARSRDELGELAGAFSRMAATLEHREGCLADSARLAGALASSLDVEQLAGDGVRELVAHAGAELGALYVLDGPAAGGEAAVLRRVAVRGLADEAPTLAVLARLAEQAIAEGRTVVARDLAADAGSGAVVAAPRATGSAGPGPAEPQPEATGSAGPGPAEPQPAATGPAGPAVAVALPLRAREELVGAIVLGGPREPAADALRFVEQNTQLVGLSLHDALNHQRVERLARELAEAGRRKDAFLAMLGHELRNPLAAIVTASELLGTLDPSAEQSARCRAIMARQTQLLGRMVDDLLDLARISQGRVELRRQPLDAGALVRAAVESARVASEAHALELVMALPAEPLAVAADPVRMEQVLGNLLRNAIKYTPRGGRVAVTVERGDGEVLFRVHDNGIGIAPEVLPLIFDLFAQAPQSLARAEGGLGIGLSVVRRLVELHGGTVTAHSHGAGRGTEVVVRLPAVPAAPREEPAAPAVAPPAARALRVLVVEDNRDFAETLRGVVASWGHEVQVMHDGSAALAAARARPPDVVLLDIGLPGTDGFEVARRLRIELPPDAGTRLVALTGYDQPEDRRRATAAGFQHHLVKPVDLEALRRVLEEVP